MSTDHLADDVIGLLMQLIEIPSFSGEESQTADCIQNWLHSKGVETQRIQNNVFAFNKHYDPAKPNLLLNSHHDTVRPNRAYTRDPHKAEIIDGKLFGLGSNDAGGALVSLLGLFAHFYEAKTYLQSDCSRNSRRRKLRANGLNSLLKDLPEIDVAIVGEPTQMQLAIAEKGLVVFDAVVKGTAGHAAIPTTTIRLSRLWM